jgi:hypothetical protein
MPSLLEILNDLDIDTSDLDGDDKNQDENKIDLSEFKVDDVPEDQRPFVQKLIEERENLTNEVSKRDLMINTMRDMVGNNQNNQNRNNSDNNNNDNKDDDKILGVGKDDPYFELANAVNTISGKLSSMDEEKAKNAKTSFEQNLVSFAQENKDVVRYAKDMDALIDEHPTLKNDIPKLYKLAKAVGEGRENKSNQKKEELSNTNSGLRSESSGVPNASVKDLSNVKSIEDAFDLAWKAS